MMQLFVQMPKELNLKAYGLSEKLHISNPKTCPLFLLSVTKSKDIFSLWWQNHSARAALLSFNMFCVRLTTEKTPNGWKNDQSTSRQMGK